MIGEIVVNRSLTIPMREITFRYSRSGGPGGQHVNKTATRVELVFDVEHSSVLTDEQRATLLHALVGRLDARGLVHVVCSEERSQLQNRMRAVAIFSRMMAAALRPRKARVATAPTKASRERRIKEKKIIGERKRLRARRDDE